MPEVNQQIEDKLFTTEERNEIFNRCRWSAEAVNLQAADIATIINHFERTNISPDKIGNIIKLICVLIEERTKSSRR